MSKGKLVDNNMHRANGQCNRGRVGVGGGISEIKVGYPYRHYGMCYVYMTTCHGCHVIFFMKPK